MNNVTDGPGESNAAADAWSPELAAHAALLFLAMLDNIGVARLVELHRNNERDTPHGDAAHREALGRIGHYIEGALHAVNTAMHMESSATTQREVAAIIRRAAGEVRWRVATLSPEAERALCAPGKRSPWDAPPAFDDRVLSILDRVNSGDGAVVGITIRPTGSAPEDGPHMELNEHFARVFGGPLPATPSRSARLFAGMVSVARARAAREAPTARDDKADDGSPGATWKRLCTVGVEARRERHPLAALRVFIVAALREGMNESRIAFRDGAVTMPRLVALGVELLRQANDRDSPRDLARAALRALGHSVEDFTNAERQERHREKRRKADGKAPKRKALDARKARA